MTKRDKLIDGIRNNPKDVRFDDACRAAVQIGFVHSRTSGSHHAFSRPGEPELLNFQDRDGKIKPYQARQLVKMLDKYDEQDD